MKKIIILSFATLLIMTSCKINQNPQNKISLSESRNGSSGIVMTSSSESTQSTANKASSSCVNIQLSESEIKTLLKDLIPKGKALVDEVYFGDGLKCAQNSETPQPYAVTDSRFKTVKDIKDYTEKVFTKDIAEKELYKYAFTSEHLKYFERNGILFHDVTIGGMGGDVEDYNLNTLKILKQTNDEITVTLEYTSLSEQGKVTKEISIKKVNKKWLLNTIFY